MEGLPPSAARERHRVDGKQGQWEERRVPHLHAQRGGSLPRGELERRARQRPNPIPRLRREPAEPSPDAASPGRTGVTSQEGAWPPGARLGLRGPIARPFLNLFIYFNWRLITMLWWFLPYIGMNQPWVYMCTPS